MVLRLDAVAWDESALRACGKGRREVKLPLPQDVGDALFADLQNARPVVADDRLFLRAIPPFVALASPPAVAPIVKRALQPAGATMESLAAILRHRSVGTTNIDARVDVGLLGEIAQPWPRGAADQGCWRRCA